MWLLLSNTSVLRWTHFPVFNDPIIYSTLSISFGRLAIGIWSFQLPWLPSPYQLVSLQSQVTQRQIKREALDDGDFTGAAACS